MKKTTQLVSTGIILALLGSNIIIGNQYISDSKEYQSEIKGKNETIRQYKINKSYQTEINKRLSIEINELHNQLDKVKKENESIKNQLKQLESRREVKSNREINMIVTAFTSNCKGCSGLTYTQYDVRNTIYYDGMRILASDNSTLPLYSIVKVDTGTESFKAIVLDRGSAIIGNKLDLLVNTYDEAIKFGRQKVTVTVLRDGKGDI